MDIVRVILGQARKPSGWFGRLGAQRMNRGHAKLAEWGLSQVTVGRETLALDVGCGGGGTVRRLAELAPEGRVYGVDFSEASVAVSRSTNRALIDAGRVEIKHASVSALPFPDEMFDLVTAIKAHFFWPDPPNHMKEVLRLLRPGGKLLVDSVALKAQFLLRERHKWSDLLHIAYQSSDELQELLVAAGFSQTIVHEDVRKGWITWVGARSV